MPGEVATRSVAIRNHCLECCGYNNAEVRRCSGPECWLYPYRMGTLDREVAENAASAVSRSQETTATGQGQSTSQRASVPLARQKGGFSGSPEKQEGKAPHTPEAHAQRLRETTPRLSNDRPGAGGQWEGERTGKGQK